jgi:hypothetical protein
MTLVSFGDFYLGWDSISTFDVCVHIGRLRLELGSPHKDHGPTQTHTVEQTDVQSLKGDQPIKALGS